MEMEMEEDEQAVAAAVVAARATPPRILPELFEKIWRSSLYEFFFPPKRVQNPENRSLFITALRTILQNASSIGYNYLSSSFLNSKFVKLLTSAKDSLQSICGEVGGILGDFGSFTKDLLIEIVRQFPIIGNNIKLFTWIATMISIPLVAFFKLVSLQNMAVRGTFGLLAYNIVVECLVLMNTVLESGVRNLGVLRNKLNELMNTLLTRARNRLNYLVNSTERLVSFPQRYILQRVNRYNQQVVSLVDDDEINAVIGPVLSVAAKNTAQELREIVIEYFKLIGQPIPPELLQNIAHAQSATQTPTNSLAPPQNTTIGQLGRAEEEVQTLQNPSAAQLVAENSSSLQKSDSESDDDMSEELPKPSDTERQRAQRTKGPHRRAKLKNKVDDGNSTGTAPRKRSVSKQVPPSNSTRSSSSNSTRSSSSNSTRSSSRLNKSDE